MKLIPCTWHLDISIVLKNGENRMKTHEDIWKYISAKLAARTIDEICAYKIGVHV